MRAAVIALLTAAFVCPGAPAPREKAREKGPASIERKLEGPWRSQSACGGTITFRADGTYEHTFQGPGGDTSSGAWEVRWDALPPTLVLACTQSTDPAKVGKKEAKLEGLNDEVLVLAYIKASPARFTRMKE